MKRPGLRGAAIASLLSAGTTLVALLVSGSLSARTLGPTDRGYFALLVLVPSLTCQVGGLGISLAMGHFVASREIGPTNALKQLQRPIFLQCALATLAAAALGLALNLGHPSYVLAGVLIAASFVLTTYVKEYAIVLLQATGNSTAANILKPMREVTWALGITVLFVAGIDDFLTVMLTCALAEWTTLALAALLTSLLVLRPDKTHSVEATVDSHEILRFGRAGYLSWTSPLDTFRLDQMYVGAAMSPASLGFYAAGAAFTTIPRVLAHTIGLTAAPFIAGQRASSGRSTRRTAVVFGVLATGLSGLTAIVVASSATWLVPALYGDDFKPAIAITQVLIFGGFLFAVRRILIDILRGIGNPGAGFRSEISGLVLFVIAAPVLGTQHGPIGVAWAFVVAAAVNVGSLLFRERHLAGRAVRRRP